MRWWNHYHHYYSRHADITECFDLIRKSKIPGVTYNAPFLPTVFPHYLGNTTEEHYVLMTDITTSECPVTIGEATRKREYSEIETNMVANSNFNGLHEEVHHSQDSTLSPSTNEAKQDELQLGQDEERMSSTEMYHMIQARVKGIFKYAETSMSAFRHFCDMLDNEHSHQISQLAGAHSAQDASHVSSCVATDRRQRSKRCKAFGVF
ncbi:MAG: hypothetical protein ACRDL7_02515 [Gaiellaceae bacterium]